LFVFWCLLFGASAQAASYLTDITEIGVGARPLGMARAFNSIADDGSSIFTNPAGLANIETYSIVSMSGNLMNEVPYIMLGGCRNTPWGVFGAGYVGASVGGIREAILAGSTPEVTGNEASYGNNTFILSYANEARRVKYVNTIDFLTDNNAKFGANLKIIDHGFGGAPSFEGTGATGFDLDIGTLFPVSPFMTTSITLRNIIPGNNVKGDELPMVTTAGAAYRLEDRNLATAAEVDFNSRGLSYRLGAEWEPLPVLSLRGGVSQKPDVFSYAVGVGTRYRGFTFDYAYHTYAELAELNTHFFSLGYTGY